MSHLVSYKTIEGNLRRTADNGLISLLNQKQLEDLAFKYFSAIDEKTGLPGYQCPYSGEVYTNYEDIVLEHIIPVASKGGTVLFNCIPTSKEVNGSDQKGAKHLITWWINSKYWDEDAPSRLEKIVNYMLDGYEQVFTEYTIEEVENSYLEIEQDKNILEEQDDLDENERETSELIKESKENGIHSYLGFIINCINTLDKCNINTSSIKERLQQLQNQNIFKDINKYQLYQNIIQKLVISRIGDNNSSYLTYTINFDIKKLMDSINLENEQDIYNEINSRLNKIENILRQNNLSTVEYFKSLKDIRDIDILYKNNISPKEISVFLENIKIGLDTKIEIFIKMLNKGNINILSQYNIEGFEGYEDIKIRGLYHNNRHIILDKLFNEFKENSQYDTARQMILKYQKVNNIEEYYQQEREKHELRAILSEDEIEFQRDLSKKIEVFINMLNKGNKSIFDRNTQETFEGYNNTKIGQFWKVNKDLIINRLFNELKDNPRYKIAREVADEYLFINDLSKKIEVFINMLNKGNSIIMDSKKNTEVFEGYPNVKIGHFWHRNSNKKIIIHRLFEELKDNPKYDIARMTVLEQLKVNTIEEYYDKEEGKQISRSKLSPEEIKFQNDISLRIDVFINMLNKGNTEILNGNNKETFEGYSNIKIAKFWNSHKDKIINKLFQELKDYPYYNVARQLVLSNLKVNTIDEYYHQERKKQEFMNNLSEDEIEFQKNLSLRIDVFINMLNKGNTNIFSGDNNEVFEGYENTPIGHFWKSNNNKNIIIKKLFEELKDNPQYDVARQTINEYLFDNSKIDKVNVFINMLNKGNTEILNGNNEETFEGYKNIYIRGFWKANRQLIIEKLFNELKDNPQYDMARQILNSHLFDNDLNQKMDLFINMLNKGNSIILSQRNTETFEGYNNIPIGSFWNSNKDKIVKRLFEKQKDDPQYDVARQMILKFLKINNIEEYYQQEIQKKEIRNNLSEEEQRFQKNLSLKIAVFIEMLNKGNSNIFNPNNNEVFEGYENVSIGSFWSNNKELIINRLFNGLKDNPKYDVAREIIIKHDINNNISKKISLFIEMLNKGNTNIFNPNNIEKFTDEEQTPVRYFWSSHKEKIMKKLFEELKDNPQYETARQIVNEYLFNNSIIDKINVFINMLNKGNAEILNGNNSETFEGYENIYIRGFWQANKQLIANKLFVELKDNPQYDVARGLVRHYIFNNTINDKIDVFIKMLNKGNIEIMNSNNTLMFEGYENIPVGTIWFNHREPIINKLFIELKDNSQYDVARQLVLSYLKINTIDEYYQQEKEKKQLKNSLSKDEIKFQRKLSLRIECFINMLNKGNSNILIKNNMEVFEGYENTYIKNFWLRYKQTIIEILFEKLKDNPQYDVARQLILINLKVKNITEYYDSEKTKEEIQNNLSPEEIEFQGNLSKKIELFIEMLNKGNTEILKQANKITFEGYSNTPVGAFWHSHKDKIINKLFEELKDEPQYNTARTIIDYYLFDNNSTKKIEIFINMLKNGNGAILKDNCNIAFDGYPQIKIGRFWAHNKDIIIKRIMEEENNNPEYKIARDLISEYVFFNNINQRVEIFINMLNKGNIQILAATNPEVFEGHPNIRVGKFWHEEENRKKIIDKLFIDLRDNPQYDEARKLILNNLKVNTIDEYIEKEKEKKKQKSTLSQEEQEFQNNLDKRIQCFIDMLNKGNTIILKDRNKEKFEGFDNTPVGKFWQHHQDKVKQKLFVELKDNSQYNVARKTIEINEMTINVDNQIPIFINMLNKGNSIILKQGNNETLEGYSNINLRYFWNSHKDRIKKKLFGELKDEPQYDTARQLIRNNEMAINVELQTPIFINMLNKGNANILKQKNNETLDGYPTIKLTYFWNNNKEKIKQKLFIELKDNREYDIARQTVLTYYKVSSYEELEVKQNKGKRLKELDKMQQELIESIKYIDEVDLNEEEQRKRA